MIIVITTQNLHEHQPFLFILSSEEEEDQNDTPGNDEDDDDRAMILATSFKGTNGDTSTAAKPPLSTFDNPIYALTGGKGLPPNGAPHYVEPDQEPDMTKEDIDMIGKSLYEDDIEL